MKNYIKILRETNIDGSEKRKLNYQSGFEAGFDTCLDMIESYIEDLEDKQKDDGIQFNNKD